MADPPQRDAPGARGARRIAAVGGVLRDAEGRLLLIRRGNEPDRGAWSLPGGRVEPGESSHDAVLRELHEETGLRCRVVAHLATVERDHPEGGVYVIDDYEVERISGAVTAGDDALEARWFAPAETGVARLSPGLLDRLIEWGVIPPPATA